LIALLFVLALATPLEEGQAHWRVMDLEKAAAKFETAVTLAADEDARAAALVWLGVVHAELGDFSRAKSAFVSALKLRADVELPVNAGEIPPRVRGLFEAARLEVEGPRALPRDLPDEPLPPIHGEATHVPAPSLAQDGHTQAQQQGSPLLVVGSIALLGSGAMLLGTAAVVDVAAGPEVFDGGTSSVVFLGAGAVMLVAGGALGIVALMQ
jgi:tetratricopeptide (TPR) repeat protein